MTQTLTLGYSTCPNDTFIFHALAHDRVTVPGVSFDIRLADVEQLNQSAKEGRIDISKLSYAALGHLRDDYALLRSGGALGRGCGPLIVAKSGFDTERLATVPVAVPGLWTTARALLGIYLGAPGDVMPLPFDQIMPAVQRGDVEAGVIIHEGRFTYEQFGLVNIVDLGEWWESKTGLPIPLGCIAARRSLGPEIARAVETAIRESVRFAFANPWAADAYIRRYAQEMELSVIRRHIDLYVNDFSVDIGTEGETAVLRLFKAARKAGLLPESDGPLFAGGET